MIRRCRAAPDRSPRRPIGGAAGGMVHRSIQGRDCQWIRRWTSPRQRLLRSACLFPCRPSSLPEERAGEAVRERAGRNNRSSRTEMFMNVVVISADVGMLALLPPGVSPEVVTRALPARHGITFLASGPARSVDIHPPAPRNLGR